MKPKKGYYVDLTTKAVVSQWTEVKGKDIPENFIPSERLNGVLRVSNDLNSVEVVDVAAEREKLRQQFLSMKNEVSYQ